MMHDEDLFELDDASLDDDFDDIDVDMLDDDMEDIDIQLDDLSDTEDQADEILLSDIDNEDESAPCSEDPTADNTDESEPQEQSLPFDEEDIDSFDDDFDDFDEDFADDSADEDDDVSAAALASDESADDEQSAEDEFDDDFDDDLSDLYDLVKDDTAEIGFMAALIDNAEQNNSEQAEDTESKPEQEDEDAPVPEESDESPEEAAAESDEPAEEEAQIAQLPEDAEEAPEQPIEQEEESVPEESVQEESTQEEPVPEETVLAQEPAQEPESEAVAPETPVKSVQGEPGFAIKHPGMVLLIELLLVIGILSGLVGAYSLTRNEETEQEIVLLTQTESASIDYDVNIRENEFFEESLLQQDEYYIRSIVEQINAKFNYEYSSTVPCDILMTYKVTGKVSANYKDSEGEKEVWTQTDILFDTQEYNGSYDKISFSVPVSFDPNKYSDKIASFEDEMGISVVAYYTVTLEVKTVVSYEGESLGSVYDISFELPLSGSVFNVLVEEKEPVSTDLNRSITPQSAVNWGAAALLIVLSAACMIGLVLFMRRVKRERELYDADFYELVNSINDRIVYVNTPLETTAESVTISDFDSFIRLADERSLPIFCYRSDDSPKDTMFYVNDAGQQYICPYSAQ